MGPQAFSTGIFGPLKGVFGLILGRSNSTMKGFQVFPRVIDQDYKGEIKNMATATKDLITINVGQWVAQLLLLPLLPSEHKHVNPTQGCGGFGSSDVYWVTQIGLEKPLLNHCINGKRFSGFIDTGADVTVVKGSEWPSSWPLTPTITHLKGIGQSQNPHRSAELLVWSDAEGNQGSIQPYVLDGLPINLWGRDLLSQLGIIMKSPNDVVTVQMLKTAFVPGKGLGKDQKGITEPIFPSGQIDTKGLGYSF